MSFCLSGDCDPGYYCNNGSHIPNPVDGVIGDICPQYKYCPVGSSVPESCLIGYMANRTGMAACELCIPGYICYPDQAPVICPQGEYVIGLYAIGCMSDRLHGQYNRHCQDNRVYLLSGAGPSDLS